jgi:LacI family transcriptional regulator
MKITIDEIAKMAGVSTTTISRVLNNKPDVSPETREKIMGIIAEYDFMPNAFAKAISLQKSHSIGLLIPHEANYIFSNPFYVEVMRGVSTEIDKLGYFLFICYPHEQNYLDIYKQKRVDGFILLSPGSFHRGIIDSLINLEVPFVSTSKVPEEKNLVFVDVDNFLGATLVMEHLIGQGHKRIAFVGKPSLVSSIDRFNGYTAIMKKYNLPIVDSMVMIADEASIQGGTNVMNAFMNLDEPPTAVLLVNDMLAIGAIRAVQERGKVVPDDMSIVGFDDVPLAENVFPALTTVRQPAFEKGKRAASMLVHFLEEKKKLKSQLLGVDLVIRNSTCAPKAGK